jgi:hypothetical protein
MTEYVYAHRDQKEHRGCGGLIACVYEGFGDWTGVCGKCGRETKPCAACAKLPYPPPAVIVKQLGAALVAEKRVDETVYRCAQCGFGFGEETLYIAAEHVQKAREAVEAEAPRPAVTEAPNKHPRPKDKKDRKRKHGRKSKDD